MSAEDSVPLLKDMVLANRDDKLWGALIDMAFDGGPLSAEDPELRRAAMAKLEESAVADARKGDTYTLMDYVAHHLPASPLRSYLLDILLHNVKVPKPRH